LAQAEYSPSNLAEAYERAAVNISRAAGLAQQVVELGFGERPYPEMVEVSAEAADVGPG
jgi:hypothetical protein